MKRTLPPAERAIFVNGSHDFVWDCRGDCDNVSYFISIYFCHSLYTLRELVAVVIENSCTYIPGREYDIAQKKITNWKSL